MRCLPIAVVLTAVAAVTSAQAAPLKGDLASLDFLQGKWANGQGVVAETGGTSTGASSFRPAANGSVLLRRDQTRLFDKTGKSRGGFDQIMMIYAEGGGLRADYAGEVHVIHYTGEVTKGGRAVVFTSPAAAGAPAFRLAYELTDPTTLRVAFAQQPPGAKDFQPIATGTLKKAPPRKRTSAKTPPSKGETPA